MASNALTARESLSLPVEERDRSEVGRGAVLSVTLSAPIPFEVDAVAFWWRDPEGVEVKRVALYPEGPCGGPSRSLKKGSVSGVSYNQRWFAPGVAMRSILSLAAALQPTDYGVVVEAEGTQILRIHGVLVGDMLDAVPLE